MAAVRTDRQLGLLWGWVAVSLLLLSPLAERLAGLLPACPARVLLGWPCPTCGATRTALHLARFEWGAALALSPLATLAWTLLLGGGLVAGAAALLGRPLPEPRAVPGWLRWGLVSSVAANWGYLVWHGV